MSLLTLEELQNLTGPHEGLCISLYMPTIAKSDQNQQNPIRLKNLEDDAEEQLEQAGLEKQKIDALLAPINNLVLDAQFWQYQDSGLVIFRSEDLFQVYQLPIGIDEQVLVQDRFLIRPVLPLLREDERFYILALSQKQVRLLEATERTVREVEVPHLPKNMQDTLGYEGADEKFHLQMVPGQASSGSGGGNKAMFHGHGEGNDGRKENILNFFHVVDKAVVGYLKDNTAPLVIAAVEYLQPIYKEANTYVHMSDEIIPGSPEHRRDDELRDEAWCRLKDIYTTKEAKITDTYKMLAGRKDNRAVKDVTEIIKAAPFGRMEVLFVDKNARRWGTFDETRVEVMFENQPRPENQDLLDFAATQTVLNGGTVIALDPEDLPENGTPAAAILRY